MQERQRTLVQEMGDSEGDEHLHTVTATATETTRADTTIGSALYCGPFFRSPAVPVFGNQSPGSEVS